MITAYAKRGETALARELFDRVPDRDAVSWNAMISGYVRIEKWLTQACDGAL